MNFNSEKTIKYIFICFYTLIFIFFILSLYFVIYTEKENVYQVLAVITASILASTAMLRLYMQNERNEKAKINRELYERRKDILYSLGNLFAQYIESYNKKDDYKSLIDDIDIVLECRKLYFDVKYNFSVQDFNLLEDLFKGLGDFIDLHKNIKYIEEDKNLNKQDRIDEALRKKSNIDLMILNSLHNNLSKLEEKLFLIDEAKNYQ